ncbi:MAG: hypothetical protein HRT61_09885 [Ekhidna sp.]|nr:hypothetical protein [Ekhidna sp.]
MDPIFIKALIASTEVFTALALVGFLIWGREVKSKPALKAYQVGDTDVVLAYTEEEAFRILFVEVVTEEEYQALLEFGEFEVVDIMHKKHLMIYSEWNVPWKTLATAIKEANGVPQYLYGWEY